MFKIHYGVVCSFLLRLHDTKLHFLRLSGSTLEKVVCKNYILQLHCYFTDNFWTDGLNCLRVFGFYERGDKLTFFWSDLNISDWLWCCGTANKEWLLQENYKYFNSFTKIRGISVSKHTAQRRCAVTDESLTVSEACRSTFNAKHLIMSDCSWICSVSC
jgi:hypothetical protein